MHPSDPADPARPTGPTGPSATVPAVRIRVLLADDEQLVRAGLSVILGSADDIVVAGEAADGNEAVAVARALLPDVVILDLHMPRADGHAAIPRLRALTPRPRILVVTTFGDERNLERAMRAGADGFLLKGSRPAQLISAVRTVHEGDPVLAPELMRALIERAYTAAPAPPGPGSATTATASLSAREREILVRLGQGRSNRDIAAELHLAETTVRTYVSRLLAKLDLDNRAQAALYAHRAGLGDG
ncbi:response regulator [Streptomyces sp. NPDC090025]|uniref:response regulator n=1 Tax=Streptomyces sp. NPDC090025 TaxID=3365922 RepID=UPI0038334F27